MHGVEVAKGLRAVLRHMTAGRAFLAQPGKERVLTLTAGDDLRGPGVIQIRALMPDARERVIAALANGPHDDAHRIACALDVDGWVMQSLARQEQE